MCTYKVWIGRVGIIALLLGLAGRPAAAQMNPAPIPGVDSVLVAPGAQYAAGSLHQFFFGASYRDLWKTPIRVPVLDLARFAGGLTPVKESGGKQTRSLRLVDPTGQEWVFRSVDKDNVSMPPRFEGTVVEDIMRDQISSSHPAAAIVADPLQEAAGVLHPHPRYAVMPDDPRLAEFREDFAGRLGMIEEYPNDPDGGRRGFAGAVDIIDSEDLLEKMNEEPGTRVDTRALLAARLMDMFMNDWDRHHGQWKWLRTSESDASPWIPIARDRDKAFISYTGLVPGLARMAAKNLVTFGATYPGITALTSNSMAFDRRMLSGLERPVWDSVARALVARLTDDVIERAANRLPPEYQHSRRDLVAILKARRDGLPDLASRFYLTLARVPDLHATDANDRARVILADSSVLVTLSAGPGEGHEYFRRRFHPAETEEIRIYLHDGDDQALSSGQASSTIPVRIVGGNGTNVLVDSAVVAGHRQRLHLYDVGTVSGIQAGGDTMFDRRPWHRQRGKMVPPGRDRGSKLGPIFGFGVHGDYGVLPRVGLSHYSYGFGKRPYARRVAASLEYATRIDGWRVELLVDQRREHSKLHWLVNGGWSELEVIRFHGFGNRSAGPSDSEFFEVDQNEWRGQVAAGWYLGPKSGLTFGPLIKHVTTNGSASRFIGVSQPYGSGDFGEAGLELALHHDVRDQPKNPREGLLLDLAASYYPALWDVGSPFGSFSASAATYFTLPVPLHPVLAFRGSGKKLVGDFPYFESAFIGGGGSLRSLEAQRYAGDASLAGTAELRVPLLSFSFILPLDLGVFGLAETGRVYLDGESPGGWHGGFGGGFWIGVIDPSSALSFTFTNNRERTGVFIKAGLSF